MSGQCPASRQGSMGRPHWLDCQGRVSPKHWASRKHWVSRKHWASRKHWVSRPQQGPPDRLAGDRADSRNRGEARWSPRGGGRSARRPRTGARPRPTPRSSATPPSPRSADRHPGPHSPGRARRPHPPAPPELAPSARYRTHPLRRIPGRASLRPLPSPTTPLRTRRPGTTSPQPGSPESSPAGVQSCQAGQAIRSSSTASWPHGSSSRWPVRLARHNHSHLIDR